MNANAKALEKGAVPLLRYRDLPAAISWLCTTLGFEKHLIVQDGDGGVGYAQLTLGNGMIMLAPVNGSALDKLMVQPDEVDGAETQSSYFFISNAASHYARAKSANADIVLDITDKDRGEHAYSCRDPEGHIWNFGTFNPWGRPSVTVHRQRCPASIAALSGSLSVMMIGSILAIFCLHIANHEQQSATRVAGWSAGYADGARKLFAHQLNGGSAPLREGLTEQTSQNSSIVALRYSLMREHNARRAVERANEEARAELARLLDETKAAEFSAREARDALEKERSLRATAEREFEVALESAVLQERALPARQHTENGLVHIAAREARHRNPKAIKSAQRRAEPIQRARWKQTLQNSYFNFSR